MAYSILHHYTYDAKRKQGTVLIGIKETLEEAEALVNQLYSNRQHPDRDQVVIHDENGRAVKVWRVDFMAQFEAKLGMRWEFKSKSSSAIYVTQVNTNGIVSCNCRGWTFKKHGKPRSCTHTDTVIGREHLQVEEKGQYWMLVDPKIAAAKAKFAAAGKAKATGPQEKFALLVAEYEAAINVMAALDPKDMYQAAAAVEVAKFKCESYMLLLEEHGIDGSAQFHAAEAKLQQTLGAH